MARVILALIVILGLSWVPHISLRDGQRALMSVPIKLNQAGEALLHEVGRLYGKPVRIELIDSDDPYYGGQSDVLDEGTPRIRVNRQSRDQAATLVHELYHLLWRHRGIPTLYVPASTRGVHLDDPTLQYIQQVFTEIRERVTHPLFFNDMRSLGYEPSVQMRAFLTQALDNDDINRIADIVIRTNLLLQAILEANDQQLVSRIEERFRSLGWGDIAAQARRLAKVILDRRAMTPDEVAALFVTIVNELHVGKAHFAVADWITKNRGPNFIERSVVILISPRQ